MYRTIKSWLRLGHVYACVLLAGAAALGACRDHPIDPGTNATVVETGLTANTVNPDAVDEIAAIAADVSALEASGTLSRGHARGLIGDLDAAVASLTLEDVSATVTSLQSFLDGVAKRERSGHLSREEAQAFRDAVAGIQLAFDVFGGQQLSGAVRDSSSIPVGFDINFFAIATFGDGVAVDPLASVNWQSSDPAVASIDANGHAIGQSAGVATISAEDPATGLITTTILTIVDPELTSIRVSPVSPTVAVGLTTCLQATAQYSDGGLWAAAHLVTWSSGDPSIADLYPVPGFEGCVTGNALGVSTITATLSGFSDSTDVTVTDPVPVLLTITPVDATVPLGTGTVGYTATALLSDGSDLVVTSLVEWSVSDPSVATIANDGLATLRSPGTTNVFAIYEGGINDITQLTVF